MSDEETRNAADFVGQIVDPELRTPHPRSSSWCDYTIALAALIRGDFEVAHDALDALDESLKQYNGPKKLLMAYVTAIEGYLTDDAGRVIAGLEGVHAVHREETFEKLVGMPRNVAPESVDLDAVISYQRKRGQQRTVTSDYVDFDAVALYLYGAREGYDLEATNERLPNELADALL